ncbi:MAG: hypothetical protein FWD78_08690 [Treponema sp.]|nr:hypothetical protein [Treponema sp.]
MSRPIEVIITLIIFLFIINSCAVSKSIYLGSDDYSDRVGAHITGINANTENINGTFPEAVYIKTRTQTFNSYHYYILDKGLIWYKSIYSSSSGSPDSPGSGPKEWTLFTETGLPHNAESPGFKETDFISEISADADELVAVSKEGNFYRYCFDSILTRSANVWFDRQGWPAEEQLYFDRRTAANLAWALGKRNKQVLYQDDIFGNQHNNGLLEIATTYVLLEDGQEICYADSGLPSDFSRNFIGPQRGTFKSVSLSASGSTMFVINKAGEMYTRLVDFDTSGSNPMGFQYTYVPFKSELTGAESASNNLSPWALPAEDWRLQPKINLTGKAAITGRITILQNGQGNSARELRVAGIDQDGQTGYWSKQIFDDVWQFKKAPLNFSQDEILVTAETENSSGQRGPSMDKSYSGYRWTGSREDNTMQYCIPDFNILEGDCRLQINWRGETCTLKLFPVEMWTYVTRDYLPGRNGPPKMFLTTLEIPENAFDSLSNDFTKLLTEEFGAFDRALFHYTIAATGSFLIMRELTGSDSVLYLTDGTVTDQYSEFNTGRYIENLKEVNRFYSEELCLPQNTALTLTELNEKSALNKQFVNELKYKIRVLNWSKLTAFEINLGYLPGNFIGKTTPLRFIPKIRIVTSYGEELVMANNAFIDTITNSRVRLYEKMIEILETRILCYNDLAKEISKKPEADRSNGIALPAWYSDKIDDYWDIAGLPRTVTGAFNVPGQGNNSARIPAAVSVVHSPLSGQNISGWYLDVNSSGNNLIFLESRGCAKNIYLRKGKTPQKKKVQLDCTLFINESACSPDELNIAANSLERFFVGKDKTINVRITFDGEKFEIRENPAKRADSLIFSGTLPN